MYKEFQTCTAASCTRVKSFTEHAFDCLKPCFLRLFLEFIPKINILWDMDLTIPVHQRTK